MIYYNKCYRVYNPLENHHAIIYTKGIYMKHLDVNTSVVKHLVELVDKYKLEEFTVTEDDLVIKIKGYESEEPLAPIQFAYAPQPPQYASPQAFLPQQSTMPDTSQSTAPSEDPSIVNITAPIVGVFYTSPSPDDEPFVKLHDRISVGDDIGIIEAMKVFSPIPAEVSGEVIEIVAKNGDLLQQGDVIMRVRISA